MLLLGACNVAVEDTAPASVSAPMNVVIVSIDTIRPETLLNAAVMPRMAEFLPTNGVLFSRHFTPGAWTYISMSSAMTGVYTTELGREAVRTYDGQWPKLPEEAVTLSERLTDAGYATHLNSTTPVVGTETRLDQGFAEVTLTDLSAYEQGLQVLDWIALQTGPWFAHVHYMSTHSPYDLLDETCSATALDIAGECPYDLVGDDAITQQMNTDMATWTDEDLAACRGAVQALQECEATKLDHDLGSFLSGLVDAGLLENTIIALYSDHGEGWGDPTFNHNETLRRTNTGGFAWMLWPGAEVQSIEVATSLVDIVPSILSLLDRPAEGLSGVVAWEATPDRTVESWFCSPGGGGDAIVSGDGEHHVIRTVAGAYYYFRPEEDPQEEVDLAGAAGEGAPADLNAQLDANAVATESYCGG